MRIMSHGTVATTANLEAIEAAYQRWRQDSQSVDPSWRYFFEGFELGSAQPAPPTRSGEQESSQVGIVRLIYAYRDLGHFLAHLDPLGDPRTSHPLLELSEFGLAEADLDRVVDTSPFIGLGPAPLRVLLKALRDTYCRTIGVEYMHIQDTRIRHWLQERMEPRRNRPGFDRAQKVRILKSLHYAELFERFLHTRYSGQKRFSLEGSETLIPLLEAIVEKAPEKSVREIILGMAHRGRLNVLANILRKPYEEVFAQFEDKYLPDSMDGDGDVKYHLGFSSDRVNSRGGKVHLSLSPNPSHLEAVDPVVEGRTRAKQTLFGDVERRWGIPLLIHGDAAFAGQGLVAETLNLSQLAGYTTGGTIHVIVNNQIGFTTAPSDARSTPYCTDVAKMIQAPVFHVNGEDPEATVYLAELAFEFRQEFKRDVVIDMFCYRRHGHNETDEPSYTQPIMYSKIRGRPPTSAIYMETLIMTGDMTVAETEAMTEKFEEKLQQSLNEVRTGPAQYPTMHGFEGQWRGFSSHYSHAPVETGVSEEVLRTIADGLMRVPEGFAVHPKIASLFQAWRQDLGERKPLLWPFAEALSFGSLLLEGTPVRLSGQDSRRGTFSQRHATLYDARTGERFSPLGALSPNQAPLEIIDSLLSEAAVLGFEWGFSLDARQPLLVLWGSRRFRRFRQRRSSDHRPVRRFERVEVAARQRPGHASAARPRRPGAGALRRPTRARYTCNAVRRRQHPGDPSVHAGSVFSRPAAADEAHLPQAADLDDAQEPAARQVGRLAGAGPGHGPIPRSDRRQHSRSQPGAAGDPVLRKDLLRSAQAAPGNRGERRESGAWCAAGATVSVPRGIPESGSGGTRYRRPCRDQVWAQEESQNNGGWFFVEPRFRAMGCDVQYVGRDASASPATGSHQIHVREQKEVVEAAIRGAIPHIVRAFLVHRRPAPPRTARPDSHRGEGIIVATGSLPVVCADRQAGCLSLRQRTPEQNAWPLKSR